MPRYPVFIPSKGRWQPGRALTAHKLLENDVPFRVVVEPQEAEFYAAEFGEQRVLELPFSNLGQGSNPARNWIKDKSVKEGITRHWQLDDNMGHYVYQYWGMRIVCPAGVALAVVEDLTDRYENVAVSGLNYQMFGFAHEPPMRVNGHVYSATLVDNTRPFRWRGRYNEDSDLCLQVLTAGLCTILVNAFLVDKKPSMTIGGGNTDTLYRDDSGAGDETTGRIGTSTATSGRLKMAQALADAWPGIATVRWRYGRPQHHVNWGVEGLGGKLQLKPDAQPVPDYGLRLIARKDKDELEPRLRQFLDSARPDGPQAYERPPRLMDLDHLAVAPDADDEDLEDDDE